MSISAQDVKKLRELTGAGMMACKKALTETNGDMDAAVDFLRKAGEAKADKKAGRTAAEGLVVVRADDSGKFAVVLEINSETDFVARDENFVNFAQTIANLALENQIETIEALSEANMTDGSKVDEARKNLINKLGENINLRRLQRISAQGTLGLYEHGGRIAVIVDIQNATGELAKDIAMHVAAMNPLYIDEASVPADYLAKEKEILMEQAKQEADVPEHILEKKITGRVNKLLKQITLLGQVFVKNDELSVEQLLKQHQAQIQQMVRFEVGEGIEKEVVDFAAEVQAQASGA